MQVAGDICALFVLNLQHLLLQPPVAVGELLQPTGHVVEPPRQVGEFRRAFAFQARVVVPARDIHHAALKLLQMPQRVGEGQRHHHHHGRAESQHGEEGGDGMVPDLRQLAARIGIELHHAGKLRQGDGDAEG